MGGILGIFSDQDVSSSLYFGLASLQHRGQQSAGIAVIDDGEIFLHKGEGLVEDVLYRKAFDLSGHAGIGHVRYSAASGPGDHHGQPLVAFSKGKMIAFGMNGSLLNYSSLRGSLEERGMVFQSKTHGEAVLALIAGNYQGNMVEAVKETMEKIQGAYSGVILSEEGLVAFRDPLGFRPLVLGKSPRGTIVASENAAVEIMGGQVLRDVAPGEILAINEKGQHSYRKNYAPLPPKHCIFEYIYLARNDGTPDGVNAYTFRRRCGELLAEEAYVAADLVVPVPDSGYPSAIGYAQKSLIPLGEGLVKNRYMGRTFIKPTSTEREMAVKLKLNPLTHVVIDKSIVLVDDSIVRGTTSADLISALKGAGAREVHLRITSPPVRYPCYYGIDTPGREDLLAARYSIEEMKEKIGADSLAFLSPEGMDRATGRDGSSFCKACFSGDYPLREKEKL